MVIYTAGVDRRLNNNGDNEKRSYDNVDDRIAKFANQITNKFVYRIPLRYFCDHRKINFPQKIDMKIKLTLETDMKILFESNKKVATIGTPDAQIILLKAPYLHTNNSFCRKTSGNI